jgi:transcriptional regulator with XRE-family HTH domain
MKKMNTHETIKNLRLNANLNQWYVAKELNISQPEYSKLENGKRKKISVELVKKLSDLYNIDIDVFFK